MEEPAAKEPEETNTKIGNAEKEERTAAPKESLLEQAPAAVAEEPARVRTDTSRTNLPRRKGKRRAQSRDDALPLRMGKQKIAEVVESSPEIKTEIKEEVESDEHMSSSGLRLVKPFRWKKRTSEPSTGEPARKRKRSVLHKSERMTEGEKALEELRQSVKEHRDGVECSDDAEAGELSDMVKCLMLQQSTFTDLLRKGQGILLRTYSIRVPESFEIIMSLREGSGFAHVGCLRVDACQPVTRHKELASFKLSSQDEQFWRERVRE